MNQPPDTSDSNPVSGLVKRRGRPPSIETLEERALINHLAVNRPSYAETPLGSHEFGSSELLEKGFFAAVRKDCGLHHKNVPDHLVFDVLTLYEGPDTEYEERNPDMPTYAALQERVLAELGAKKIEITRNAKRAGGKVAPRTQRSQIEAAAPELLQDLVHQRITPETMQTRLRNFPVVLPIPSVRSLRRMAQQIRGQKPTPK